MVVPGKFSWHTIAHELGHIFGLRHDFRDNTYIMSYGLRQDQLSACHAEFLSVHTYFNPDIPDEQGEGPRIDVLSSTEYAADSKNISIQLRVLDEDGLHQAILFGETREPHSAAGFLEVKACRRLAGKKPILVEFDYDGVIPSDSQMSFWNPDTHPIFIHAVDAKGNVGYGQDELICKNCPLTLVKHSGDNQQGAPGALLANPLTVEVRDKNGAGFEGLPATFTVTAGDGKLDGRFTVENLTTNVSGRAQSTLRLGPNAGENTVEVSVTGFDPVIFNAVGVGTPTTPITGGDYRMWHLPDGAITRIGKGYLGRSDRAVTLFTKWSAPRGGKYHWRVAIRGDDIPSRCATSL